MYIILRSDVGNQPLPRAPATFSLEHERKVHSHESDVSSELGGVNAAKCELAVGHAQRRRRLERYTKLFVRDEACTEGVVSHSRHGSATTGSI